MADESPPSSAERSGSRGPSASPANRPRFDPSCHEELPLAHGDQLLDEEKVDRRWVRIRRPTIVVGGDAQQSLGSHRQQRRQASPKLPLQMKSNCGTLVIDDFGRQRIAPAELLNRWIVPLEKRHDFLLLASGRKFMVPFDQLIVFSTNLEPKDLVDEAFLRRIPYKIEIENPTADSSARCSTARARRWVSNFESRV